jgi:hypothetical protein
MSETTALATVSNPGEPVIRSLESYVWSDDQVTFARNLKSGESVFLPAFAAKLVEGCRSFAPASAHVARYLEPFRGMERWRLWRTALQYQIEIGGGVQLSGLVQRTAEDLLASLLEKGVLQTRQGFAQSLSEALGTPTPAPKITVFGIPTANRPEMLKRALDSYLPHFRARNRVVRVLVSDDSRDETVAEKNRAVAKEAGQQHDFKVEYLGQAERRELVEKFAQGNDDRRRALQFLLLDSQGLGQTYGMARNALLLASVGELLLCADDDTLCRLSAASEQRPGLECYEGSGDVMPMREFATREQALASVRALDGDLLAYHEQHLGRSLAAGMLEQANQQGFTVGELSQRAARSLLRAEDRVALTVNGLVGDSGSTTEFASALTQLGPDKLQAYLTNPDEALKVMESRQVVKVGSWARASRTANFMTTFYGHDNRRWTVPYFPFLRSEDQIFKEMLIRVDPSAQVVYLPSALEHAPAPRAKAKNSPVVMLDMFLAALAEMPRPVPGASVREHVRELGQHLISFAEQPLPKFRRAVLEVVSVFTLKEISRHRRFLKNAGPRVSGPISEAVVASLAGLEGFLSQKEIPCAETAWVEKLGSAQKAEEMSQQTIRQMGEAISVLASLEA